ncbi:MAG: indolepyruvate ferredoxin oxidoreductase subunit alpha [ANME-2 cluster archaeon]|nr:indolepyruvate ferredoxin oxidoreductase subunit alpha [ANME-2 cluster archaeon]MBC2701003.1 indolepyruvate ferredoxin oxidoreductase subunit alpha [ANME-2 cluster archaeon]MBC2707591.1 indolepyruvate ferredoxin oxidoreductase subunit alpha [ANME-2 cluster archaeon]MBC2747936.1 indolepyruvate ferredoxin oxidoreductase subunit alpha [ANME-2 cluster archaeon]
MPPMSEPITGSHALVFGALDSGISLATGVPGYPITGIMKLLLGSGVDARWSINEKVALEAALGASATGRRSLVTVKHVGMNILADPLITSATHTIGAGLVILTGDDPGVKQSQNEQDSRYYGLLAEVPVLDPSGPEAAYNSMRRAFLLSEKVRTPVIIRLTDRLNSMEEAVKRTPAATGDFQKFDRDTWTFTMKGKHQRFHCETYPLMEKESTMAGTHRLYQRGKGIGIISSGYLSSLVEMIISADRFRNISHLALTQVNPLPRPIINKFIAQHSRILVIEETEPVIEEQIYCSGVLGKLTGHTGYGIIEASDIILALENIDMDKISRMCEPETRKSRGLTSTTGGLSKNTCEDCPYLGLYEVLGSLDVPVAGDLGCSVRTAPPPMEVVDIAYSLGSSIATATGFAEKGIALVGDFGLVHTGLQGLIEAVHHHKSVLVVVLQNNIAALTGGQDVPDMTNVVQTLVPDTLILDIRNTWEDELATIIKTELGKDGVSVMLARATCTKY